MGKKSGGNEAEAARRDEAARQARVRDGTKRIGDIFDSNFSPEYFDRQASSYIDYARPQLGEQRDDATKELTFSLARGGKLESSTRADLGAELEKRFALEDQKIRDDALTYKKNAMTGVEDARSGLVATLNATGDAEGAANSAIARATALSQPTAFSPIANVFADFTSGLGTQAAAERAYSYGGPKPTYNTGLFGTPSGAVAVKK
jgi:hypothetical protein